MHFELKFYSFCLAYFDLNLQLKVFLKFQCILVISKIYFAFIRIQYKCLTVYISSSWYNVSCRIINTAMTERKNRHTKKNILILCSMYCWESNKVQYEKKSNIIRKKDSSFDCWFRHLETLTNAIFFITVEKLAKYVSDVRFGNLWLRDFRCFRAI